MRKNVKNWLVIFQPKDQITVDTMLVIDSWSSTNGTREGATMTMKGKRAEYAAKWGEGIVSLVESKPGWPIYKGVSNDT